MAGLLAQYRGGGDHLLCVPAEAPESDAHRGDHRLGEIAGKGLVERALRLGPGARRGMEIESQRHRVQQLDREQGQPGGIGGDAAGEPVDVSRVPPRHGPGREPADGVAA